MEMQKSLQEESVCQTLKSPEKQLCLQRGMCSSVVSLRVTARVCATVQSGGHKDLRYKNECGQLILFTHIPGLGKNVGRSI